MRNSDCEHAVLSTKGQLVIPKEIRNKHNWKPGQKLLVVDRGDEVVLEAESMFEETTVDEVAGMLEYSGPRKTLQEMDKAVAKAMRERGQ